MFRRLADLAYRRPRTILAAAFALAVVSAAFGAATPRHLSSSDDDFQDKSAESFHTLRVLARETGVVPGPSILVAVPRGQAPLAIARLRRDPAIARVRTLGTRKGRVIVGGYLREGSPAGAAARRLKGALPGVVGGPAVASEQVRTQSERDLFRAELIAFPLLALLGIWIFRSVVAAVLPLAAGVMSIATTLALLRGANTFAPISVFALNLVTGAGLGLAIDYSLLLVSRYREELARVGPGLEALRTTLATAGRTVAFSAVTVAAAFASLLVFPLGFLRSMAIGGIIVAPFAGLVALTVVPALFALLGTRIDALSIRRRPRDSEGGWYRFAHAVMRRPLPIAIATAAVLVALGLPFLGVRFTAVTAAVLPQSASARQVQELVGGSSTMHVLAPSPAVAATVRTLPDVASVGAPRRVGSQWTFDVVPRAGDLTDRTKELVRRLRSLPGVSVGGLTAWYLDTSSSLLRHLPLALAVLGLTVVALLYLVTRSVILPVKAVIMNALSLSAAFGILVWIFQDGRLEGLLRYRSEGALELTQPILLFAIAFGLATDYGVFLLSRIREAHDDGLGNREAVALGLERTGRVVTAAALLFCVAVGAFATSSIVLVKQIGVGIAAAVAIDASLVRALLVPSLMALLGDWNWWRPGRGRG
ncbi:MAG TPA: MMPL family transporter [Gaiellaceae bacterium]|jgi:RND superfamily putative drug exporter|nr:MMPL family transporter [Gaiellaceae bacterium]